MVRLIVILSIYAATLTMYSTVFEKPGKSSKKTTAASPAVVSVAMPTELPEKTAQNIKDVRPKILKAARLYGEDCKFIITNSDKVFAAEFAAAKRLVAITTTEALNLLSLNTHCQRYYVEYFPVYAACLSRLAKYNEHILLCVRFLEFLARKAEAQALLVKLVKICLIKLNTTHMVTKMFSLYNRMTFLGIATGTLKSSALSNKKLLRDVAVLKDFSYKPVPLTRGVKYVFNLGLVGGISFLKNLHGTVNVSAFSAALKHNFISRVLAKGIRACRAEFLWKFYSFEWSHPDINCTGKCAASAEIFHP